MRKEHEYKRINSSIEVAIDHPIIFIRQYPYNVARPLVLSTDDLIKINEIVNEATIQHNKEIREKYNATRTAK